MAKKTSGKGSTPAKGSWFEIEPNRFLNLGAVLAVRFRKVNGKVIAIVQGPGEPITVRGEAAQALRDLIRRMQTEAPTVQPDDVMEGFFSDDPEKI